MNFLKFLLSLIILFTIFDDSESLNRFIRGRRFNENKKQFRLFELANNVTDLYYDQELDHFVESDSRTWKQVI